MLSDKNVKRPTFTGYMAHNKTQQERAAVCSKHLKGKQHLQAIYTGDYLEIKNKIVKTCRKVF